MRKKLKPAKMPLPRFDNSEEAAEYFESHSVADVWDKLERVPPVQLSKQLERAILSRKGRPV
jgi:hypothetical protein